MTKSRITVVIKYKVARVLATVNSRINAAFVVDRCMPSHPNEYAVEKRRGPWGVYIRYSGGSRDRNIGDGSEGGNDN